MLIVSLGLLCLPPPEAGQGQQFTAMRRGGKGEKGGKEPFELCAERGEKMLTCLLVIITVAR